MNSEGGIGCLAIGAFVLICFAIKAGIEVGDGGSAMVFIFVIAACYFYLNGRKWD